MMTPWRMSISHGKGNDGLVCYRPAGKGEVTVWPRKNTMVGKRQMVGKKTVGVVASGQDVAILNGDHAEPVMDAGKQYSWRTLSSSSSSSSSSYSPAAESSHILTRLAGGMVLAGSVLVLNAYTAHAISGGGGMGTSLSFKDFSGQDLKRKNFNKADMRGINLTGADLEGSSLFGAILAEAQLEKANLRYADLELADMEGANLKDAVLEGAMLTNAQVKKVKSIEGADFTDALIRRDVQLKLCEIATGTNPITGVDTKESLNCP